MYNLDALPSFDRRYVEALTPLMNMLIRVVRSGQPDLTNRQMLVLIWVHAQPGPHTVRGISKTLKLSPPVVSRAFSRMHDLGLTTRMADVSDRRSVFFGCSDRGRDYLATFL